MKATFKTMDEVNAYIADGAKRYGGKNKFLSSAEYNEVYPIIEQICAAETTTRHTQNKATADAAMSEVGALYGDRVSYTIQGAFFSTEKLTGTVVNRKSLPMVRLDEKHSGKRHVRWHKGWRLVSDTPCLSMD